MEEGHHRRAYYARLIRARSLLLVALAFALNGPHAAAEKFPSRPIHMILPYAPGGIIEFVGRMLSQKLGEILHAPVVVEDRAGAGQGALHAEGQRLAGRRACKAAEHRRLAPCAARLHRPWPVLSLDML